MVYKDLRFSDLTQLHVWCLKLLDLSQWFSCGSEKFQFKLQMVRLWRKPFKLRPKIKNRLGHLSARAIYLAQVGAGMDI